MENKNDINTNDKINIPPFATIFKYIDLAKEEKENGNFIEACNYWQKIIDIGYPIAIYYYYLGELYAGLGKNEIALKNFITYAHLNYLDETFAKRENYIKSLANTKRFMDIAPWIITNYELNFEVEKTLKDIRICHILHDNEFLFYIGFLFVLDCEPFMQDQLITNEKIEDYKCKLLWKESKQTLRKGVISRIIEHIGAIGIVENLNLQLVDKDVVASYYINDSFKTTSPLEKFMLKEKLNPIDRTKNQYLLFLLEGSFKIDDGDYLDAIESLNKSLELNNSYAQTYLTRAEAYLKSGDKIRALKDYNKATELDSTLTDPLFQAITQSIQNLSKEDELEDELDDELL